MPRGIPNRSLESEQVKAGQDTELVIPNSASIGSLDRTDQRIEVVDGPSIGDYAEQLAFNEEFVEVTVLESTDQNAEVFVDVYVNGVPQRFLRGQRQRVRRKFLEVLARAKQTRITTSIDMSNGEPANRIQRHVGLRYPFRVDHDANPKGIDWLRKVMQEA